MIKLSDCWPVNLSTSYKQIFFQVPVLSTFWFSFEIPYLTTFLSFLAFIQQWQCRETGKRGQRERGRRTAKGHRLDSNPACWPPAKPLGGLEDLCRWPCAWHPNPLHLCCWPRCRPSKLHRLCWLHCQPPELLCQCHWPRSLSPPLASDPEFCP